MIWLGPVQFQPSEVHSHTVPLDNRLFTLIATEEIYMGQTKYSDSFVWSFPQSASDRQEGRFCLQTGYWAAGHSIKNVDGVDFIDEFAPEKVKRDGY